MNLAQPEKSGKLLSPEVRKMQRLITLGFMVDLAADFASILSNSPAALAASLVLGTLPAAAAFGKLVLGATDNIAEFRAEPIRR
jgi:hypothetical protein